MKQRYETEKTGDNTLIAAYTIEVTCEVCGFDITETDINIKECPSCEVYLGLKQSVTVEVTPTPMFGAVLE
jgi:rubrerythrin